MTTKGFEVNTSNIDVVKKVFPNFELCWHVNRDYICMVHRNTKTILNNTTLALDGTCDEYIVHVPIKDTTETLYIYDVFDGERHLSVTHIPTLMQRDITDTGFDKIIDKLFKGE